MGQSELLQRAADAIAPLIAALSSTSKSSLSKRQIGALLDCAAPLIELHAELEREAAREARREARVERRNEERLLAVVRKLRGHDPRSHDRGESFNESKVEPGSSSIPACTRRELEVLRYLLRLASADFVTSDEIGDELGVEGSNLRAKRGALPSLLAKGLTEKGAGGRGWRIVPAKRRAVAEALTPTQ